MIYHRNFAKYHAFTLREHERATQERDNPEYANINVNAEGLFEEFRRRFPTFFPLKK